MWNTLPEKLKNTENQEHFKKEITNGNMLIAM